jgi:ubiquinone/menaquinone biosynthesis C-methylase UbiE
MTLTHPTPPPTPAICDYEGSGYHTDFWKNKGRDYEDAVERIALRAMLPPAGERYIEFGAGFGRLADEAANFKQVVLLDYSRTLLQEARTRLNNTPERDKYVYVAADVNHLPFASDSFDTAIMVRVLHHMPDPLGVLTQIRSALAPQATFILEFANKRNLKAMIRYALRKQTWSPYTPEAVEFVKLNFDFHPATVAQWLVAAGFQPGERRAVSFFRLGVVKRTVPLGILKGLESVIQPLGAGYPVSPSVFVKNTLAVNATPRPMAPLDQMFVNPYQKTSRLVRQGDHMVCPQTGMRWAIHEGLYDFKEALS